MPVAECWDMGGWVVVHIYMGSLQFGFLSVYAVLVCSCVDE